MGENLKVTHYNDGGEIPTGLSGQEWANTKEGSYAIYDGTSGTTIQEVKVVNESWDTLYVRSAD